MPASQSQGKAEANRVVSIDSLQLTKENIRILYPKIHYLVKIISYFTDFRVEFKVPTNIGLDLPAILFLK